jgi:probable HAF family extracellular repeat protein
MHSAPCFALLLVSAAGPAALAQTFTPIPDLPGGAAFSRARAASPDGSVIVGVSSGNSGDEAFRWAPTDAAAQGLSDIPGGTFSSDALAASNGGAIFGWGTNSSGNAEAVRWTPAVGVLPLGFLSSGGYISRAYACSADGQVACGENLFQPQGSPPPLPVTQAFRWSPATGMVGLGFLPGGSQFLSTARAMSADGSVIVGWATDSSFANRPFRWTQATGMVDITGGAFSGTARGVSGNGRYIVGSDAAASRAYIWDSTTAPGAITLLQPLPAATSSAAADVSNDGLRVIGASGGRACMWTLPIGDVIDLTTLAPAGWTLQVAQSMSDDGLTIVGYGLNPSGQTQAWAITFPPLPCDSTISDFNGDGDFGTDQDIEAFFACLAGNCCITCYEGGSDINGDGDFGTDQDIEAFFRCLAGNCCF